MGRAADDVWRQQLLIIVTFMRVNEPLITAARVSPFTHWTRTEGKKKRGFVLSASLRIFLLSPSPSVSLRAAADRKALKLLLHPSALIISPPV